MYSSHYTKPLRVAVSVPLQLFITSLYTTLKGLYICVYVMYKSDKTTPENHTKGFIVEGNNDAGFRQVSSLVVNALAGFGAGVLYFSETIHLSKLFLKS